MSLSCDNLVRDLGNVGTPARVVAAVLVLGLTEGELSALTHGQWVCVVKHVGLRESRFVRVDVLDRHVGLGQPLSLHVDAFLRVVLLNQILSHQVRDLAHLLLVKCKGSRASEACLSSVLEDGAGWSGRGSAEVVAILSLEETLFVQTVMVGEEWAEAFSWAINGSIIQIAVLLHILLVDDAHHGFGLNHMNLGVLVLLLVSCLTDSKAIVAHELLCNLLGLAVVRAKRSWNTSRV